MIIDYLPEFDNNDGVDLEQLLSLLADDREFKKEFDGLEDYEICKNIDDYGVYSS